MAPSIRCQKAYLALCNMRRGFGGAFLPCWTTPLFWKAAWRFLPGSNRRFGTLCMRPAGCVVFLPIIRLCPRHSGTLYRNQFGTPGPVHHHRNGVQSRSTSTWFSRAERCIFALQICHGTVLEMRCGPPVKILGAGISVHIIFVTDCSVPEFAGQLPVLGAAEFPPLYHQHLQNKAGLVPIAIILDYSGYPF